MLLVMYQRSEKQIYIGRHNTSFSGPLPLTDHILFIYCYDHTVFIHLLHFWENNFNTILMNLTSQLAQEADVALNFLQKEGNGTMALNDSDQRHPTNSFWLRQLFHPMLYLKRQLAIHLFSLSHIGSQIWQKS